MKKKKIKAYTFYGIILFVTLAIIVILRTDFAENLLKNKIAEFIANKTDTVVSIGSIDLSVLSSSITLSSLAVKKGKTYNVYIKKLTVVVEPPSIFKKKPQLKVVYVNGANISFVMRNKPLGKTYGKVSETDVNRIKEILPVIIKHIVVNNTALSVSIPAYGANISAKNVSMDIYPDIRKDKGSGIINIAGLSFSGDGNAFTLSNAQFSGDFDAENITINSLKLYSGAFKLFLNGYIKNYDDPEFNLQLKASVNHAEQFNSIIKMLPVSLPEISGSYTFDGAIKGGILNLSSTGNITFKNMIVGEIKAGAGRVTYALKSHKLYIKAGVIDIAGGRIKFNGEMNLADSRLSSEFLLNLNGVSFGELLYALAVPTPYVDADITGSIAVHGTFNPIKLVGKINTGFRQFSVYNGFFRNKKKQPVMTVQPVNIKSDFIISSKAVYLMQTTVKSVRSVVHAYTALYFTGAMFLKFYSTRMDMRDVSPIADIPYTGTGSIKGYVAGPFSDIVIDGDVSFAHYSMEHIKMGNTTGRIVFKNNILSLKSVKAAYGKSNLYVDGGINFGNRVELHMGILFEPLELSDIAGNISSRFTAAGSISGSARIDGPVLGMNGFADLSLSKPEIYHQSFDKGIVRLTINDGTFHINKAVFTKGNNSFHAVGDISENGNINLRFNSGKFNADNIDAVISSKVPLKAAASFTGNVSGSIYNPVADAFLQLKDITYNNRQIPDGSASMHFSNNSFSAHIALFNNSVTVNSSLNITARRPFELTAHFNKFNILPFVSAFSGIGVTSDVTGKLWLVGDLKKIPDSLVGYIYLNTLAMGNRFVAVQNNKPVFMDIAGNDVYFRDFSITGKGSFVKLKGFFNLKGNINTLVDADINLSYLPVFTKIVAGSSGSFKINARVYGKKNNIVLNGNAELNGDATFANLPITLSGVHLAIIMTNNNISIKDLSGDINSGTMSGGGRIITSGLMPRLFDLSLNFKGMNFIYNNAIPLKLDGVIGIKGRYPQPVLEGNIKIVSASYTDYINWENEMLQFQHRRFEPKKVERRRRHLLKLNVGVNANNSIVIDNNIISCVLSAELKIIGDVSNPIVVGNISTNGGKIYYRSTTFNIDNALVTYTREHPQNPFVDVRASTTHRFMVNNEYTEYRIYLTIAGMLDKLNLSLTSYPPNLNEVDIISLLTYGITPADLMKVGVSSAAAYEVGMAVGSKLAKDIFSELMGNEGINKIKKFIWVDNLQIEPYYPIGAPSTSIRLIATKRITNDLNILYSYDLNGYNLQHFQGEYKLSKRLYLLGNWDNGVSSMRINTPNNGVGNFGADLKYKFAF